VQIGQNLARKDYAEALYKTVSSLAKLVGGAASAGALTANVLRNVIEGLYIGAYQEMLIKRQWELEQAIQTARARDPEYRAAMKRILDLMNSDTPKLRDAQQRALGAGGIQGGPLSELFTSTGLSNPFRAATFADGVELLSPGANDVVRAIPGINPAWLREIERCHQAARTVDVKLWNACGKNPDGTYVPAFLSGTNAPSSRAPSGNASSGVSTNTRPRGSAGGGGAERGQTPSAAPNSGATGAASREKVATGVSLNWRGAEVIGWKIVDEAQKYILKDHMVVGAKSTSFQEMAPGTYFVIIDETGFQPLRVTVRTGEVTAVSPSVGTASISWGGAVVTGWKIVDEAQKYILRDHMVVGAKSTSHEDMVPGNYYVIVDQAGFKPLPVTVQAGEIATVTPVVGTLALSWRSAELTGWKIIDGAQQYIIKDHMVANNRSPSLEDLVPGNYFVVIEKMGDRPIAFSVRPGETTPVSAP
jgi:hypothetical protein